MPPKPPSIPLPSILASKRGRGRLLKCEKHRRWKKRCPVDCSDKPMTATYDEIDDLEDELGGTQDEDFKDSMNAVSSAGLLPPLNSNPHGSGRLSLGSNQMMNPLHMNLSIGHLGSSSMVSGMRPMPMHSGSNNMMS